MSIKSKTYAALDTTLAKMLPKYTYYRELGVELEKKAQRELPKIFASTGKGNSDFLSENIKAYENYAYFEVQAQTLLIDMDIVGIENIYQNKNIWDAGFATGLLWYTIKLIDNKIDSPNMSKYEVNDFLNSTFDAWNSDSISPSLNKKDIPIIEATTFLLHSGYVGNPDNYITILKELADAEYIRWNSKPTERINTGKDVFSLSADLICLLVRKFSIFFKT